MTISVFRQVSATAAKDVAANASAMLMDKQAKSALAPSAPFPPVGQPPLARIVLHIVTSATKAQNMKIYAISSKGNQYVHRAISHRLTKRLADERHREDT